MLSNYFKKKNTIIHQPILLENNERDTKYALHDKKKRYLPDLYSDDEDTLTSELNKQPYTKEQKRKTIYSMHQNLDKILFNQVLHCNLCNTSNDNNLVSFSIMSCCNSIYHVQCITNVLNINSNNINITKLPCPNCKCIIQHVDLMNICTKYIISTKNTKNIYINRLDELNLQKSKIEQEIHDITNTTTQLDTERQQIQKLINTLYSFLF